MLKKVEKLTQTEEALLALADEQENASPQHRTAVNLLRDHGLPTRRVEAWHYTDLRNRLGAVDKLALRPGQGDFDEWYDSYKPVHEGFQISFLNGQLFLHPSDKLPAGINLSECGMQGFRDATDAVALLHALAGKKGVSLTVADDATIDEPLLLVHWTAEGGLAALRHKVEIGANADATLIEQHSGGAGGITSACVSDLSVADGAKAVWVIDQDLDTGSTHLAQLNVLLGANADLTILVLNTGGALVRQEINVVLKGEASKLNIRGVNLVGGKAHIDVTTSLVHEVPHTIANELFRNVATDSGRGVFQGAIKVTQAAQKTDARMACNTLLLSDEAEFSAKPELEIFADDVVCAHGATVTDILDDHLFYLRARGISERDARGMLVRAFVEEAFDEIENENLRDVLNERIETWLGEHA
jgi:Fe-S cluster assembly protein SufD